MSAPEEVHLKGAQVRSDYLVKRDRVEREIAEGFIWCCDSCPVTWAELLQLLDVQEAARLVVASYATTGPPSDIDYYVSRLKGALGV